MTIILALAVIIPWGTWVVLSQNVKFHSSHSRNFYISLAFLVMAGIIYLMQPPMVLNLKDWLLPMAGGAIWVLSGYFAFNASNRIGVALAGGIWSPLNIVTGILWGALFFGEFRGYSLGRLGSLGGALAVLLTGVMLVIFPGRNKEESKANWSGVLQAGAAGLLWGSYFIPINAGSLSLWYASLPMAIGMFLSSVLLVLISRSKLRLANFKEYALSTGSGLLWGVGNYAMLMLTKKVGTATGFTLAQLCVVVNAALGIFLLKEPKPGTPRANRALVGILIACTGGILIGLIRN